MAWRQKEDMHKAKREKLTGRGAVGKIAVVGIKETRCPPRFHCPPLIFHRRTSLAGYDAPQ